MKLKINISLVDTVWYDIPNPKMDMKYTSQYYFVIGMINVFIEKMEIIYTLI